MRRGAFESSPRRAILVRMPITIAHLKSPLGPLAAEFNEQGALRRLDFLDQSFAAHWSARQVACNMQLREDAARAQPLERELEAYFAGTLRAFEHPLDLAGTDFQRRVWKALCEIPYGEVISYGQLAERLGKSGASRAVGSANGANPVPVLVPCHRVIAANGGLGGYSAGLDRKRQLLELEGALLPLGA